MKRIQKLLSLLLALIMVFSLLPAGVLAASGTGETPYRIVHLDCGRKYFSVANICKLIDTMAQYGYNQLQLAFGNGGCRFLLDDMSLSFSDSTGKTVNMDSDTVKKYIQGGNNAFNGDTRVLEQSDMNAILTYAGKKGIEIVPMLNMPGHATAIAYGNGYGSNGLISISDETARNYAFALLGKYAAYFRAAGCRFFHFGADESGYTGSNMTTFLSGCAEVITKAGMTPRAFNDATNVADMPKSVQITYWHKESGSKSAIALANSGYDMINTHGRWYYVIKTAQGNEIGSKYWQGTVSTNPVSVELPELKATVMDQYWVGEKQYFDNDYSITNGSMIEGSLGTMFCIWCDASQDTYLTDSDVISDNENYGALYQLQKLAEHYWPDDIPMEPTAPEQPANPVITLDNGSAVPTSVTEGETLCLQADKSVTWTTSDEKILSLAAAARSAQVSGTQVTVSAVAPGTASITAEDGSGGRTVILLQVLQRAQTGVVEVNLQVGESRSFTVTESVAAGPLTTGDEYIAQASVTENPEQQGSYQKVTQLQNGKTYLIENVRRSTEQYAGNDLLTNVAEVTGNTAGLRLTGTPSANPDPSAKWTYTAVNNSGRLQDGNGNYLTIGNGTAGVSQSAVNLTLTYSAAYDSWTILQEYNNYLNQFSGGDSRKAAGYYKGFTDESSRWNIYEWTEPSNVPQNLTITGTGEGTTSCTVGSTTYNITVSPRQHTETLVMNYGETHSVPEGVQLNITAGTCVTVSGNTITAGNEDGTAAVAGVKYNAGNHATDRYQYNITVSSINWNTVPSLPVQLWITNTYVSPETDPTSLVTVSVSAQQAYTEAGVALSSLVPQQGYKKDGNNVVRVVYWRGTVLHDGKTPVLQGEDLSTSGDQFQRVRYWNGAWQYFHEQQWKTMNLSAGKDTVVAYYLQLNQVSPAIVTGTQHYGNPPTVHPGDNSSNGFALTAFAVVYPDGTLSRTEEQMYYTGMLRGFWEGSSIELGAIYAADNDSYRISKMTVTWGANVNGRNPDDWYRADPPQYDGEKWGVAWDKIPNAAGELWYDETVYWQAGDSETAMIDGDAENLKFTFKKNAALILIYLEPIATEDSLRIVYWDDNSSIQIETNPTPIPVLVAAGKTFLNIQQTSPVQVGTFTLDDDAYITNASGENQGFNKVLSTVPGVAPVYQSGMYVYRSAELSQDGKTLTLHFGLKNAAQARTYVIDYGLPLKIPAADFDITNPETIASVSLEAGRETLSQTGNYGTVTIAGANENYAYVTYTLHKMLDTNVTIPLYVRFNGQSDTSVYYIHIIPAASVYYEESFVNFEGDGWTSDGQAPESAVFQAADQLGSGRQYGFDSAYASCVTYSMGTAQKVTVNSGTNAAPPTAAFTFTGTGFDIISLTDNTSGAIKVNVTAVGNTPAYNKNYVVNNYYGLTRAQNGYLQRTWKKGSDGLWHVSTEVVSQKPNDGAEVLPDDMSDPGPYVVYEPNYTWEKTTGPNALYQIPVMKVTDLAYGQYTVTVTPLYEKLFDTANAGAYSFWMDAVRIYDPAGRPESGVIHDAYQADGELNPAYMELRDLLLSAGTFNNGNVTEVTGIVFIDGDVETPTVSDYRNYGPNNEVYLKKNQSIAFKMISSVSNPNIQLGAKLAQGSAGTITVRGTDPSAAGTTLTLATATEMYYRLSDLGITWTRDGGNYVSSPVIITNTSEGDGIVSLTNLKAPGAVIQPVQSVQTAARRSPVSAMLSAFIPMASAADAAPAYDLRIVVTPELAKQAAAVLEDQMLTDFERQEKIPYTRPVIFSAILSALQAPAAQGKTYVDISSDAWYYDYVMEATEAGLMEGSGGRFDPNGKLTRAMLVTVLYRMAGRPASAVEAPFADVDPNAWYGPAVAWACDQGIVNGVSPTAYAPHSNVTRQDMAAMMARYAQACGLQLASPDGTLFRDDPAIADYAKDGVYKMKAGGILSGRPGGEFDPTGITTRAEAAKVLTLLAKLKQ